MKKIKWVILGPRMKKISLYLSSLLLLLSLAFCGRPDAVNTQEMINNSQKGIPLPLPEQLDSSQFGTYRGVLPSTNGGAREVVLTLYMDDTYELKEVHLGEPDKLCTFKAEFKYDDDKGQIRLPMDGDDPRFVFNNGQLQLLDKEGNPLETQVSESPFLFKSDLDLHLAIWQIEKIADKPVSEEQASNSHLRFLNDESVSYTGGCNQCRGSYKKMASDKIFFKVGACTKKMCEGEDLDSYISNALNASQSFRINENRLILKNSKGEVTAVFRTLLKP